MLNPSNNHFGFTWLQRPRTIYSMIVICEAVWCSAIVLAPVLASSGTMKEPGMILYGFFSPICHQFADRSFIIDGMPLGVCSRCSAIYFSFFIGTLACPFVQNIKDRQMPSRYILICSWIPMMVDAFPFRFGMYEATLVTRVVTGSIAGFALAFFIVPAMIQGFTESAAHRTTPFYKNRGVSNATKTG